MFEKKVKELFEKLGEYSIMCLATSAENRVTARMMSFIVQDGKLYFQTDSNMAKYKQICENPCIAVCVNNIQIEGECSKLGHPLATENNFFAEKYKQFFASSFENYSSIKTEVLFQINPSFISVWDYEDGKPYQEFFDFAKNTYEKKYYNV